MSPRSIRVTVWLLMALIVSSACVEDAQGRAVRRVANDDCERPCTREYVPVCGSNGVTYANRCLFRNARRCKYRGQLSIVKVQACESSE